MKKIWIGIVFLASTMSMQAQANQVLDSPRDSYATNAPHKRSPQARAHIKRKANKKAFTHHQRSLKRMALADGKITRNERKMLRKSAKRHQRKQGCQGQVRSRKNQ